MLKMMKSSSFDELLPNDYNNELQSQSTTVDVASEEVNSCISEGAIELKALPHTSTVDKRDIGDDLVDESSIEVNREKG